MSLLYVKNLCGTFPVRRKGDWPWTKPALLQAVSGASLTLNPGETLGLVGESGSGKSTLARAIVGTVQPSDGQVLWEGQGILSLIHI